jgi:hypothetical protein
LLTLHLNFLNGQRFSPLGLPNALLRKLGYVALSLRGKLMISYVRLSSSLALLHASWVLFTSHS